MKAHRIASIALSKMRRKLRCQMETSRVASTMVSNFRRTLRSNVKRSRAASILPADEMTAEATSKYLYRPLNKDPKEIRLLILEPGHGNQIIRCRLSHTILDGCTMPRYETVSYVCGDPELRSKIMLHDHATYVLASSEVVLRRMRLPTAKRVLWVDSICIDQKNTAERGHQVGMMYEIYASTSRNLIWLGPDDGHTEQAISSIRAVLNEMVREYNGLETLGAILGTDAAVDQFSSTGLSLANLDKICDSLVHFFSSPWFERLWVVQEVSLAPTSMCYRGEYEIPILDVLHVATSLGYKYRSISEYIAPRDMVSFDHAAAIFDLTDREHGWYWRSTKGMHNSLLNLLGGVRGFKTVDPRDHVFAILGLWRQQPSFTKQNALLDPDYSLDVCDVFQNATRYVITDDESLQALASVFESDMDLGKWPSWVPRFDHKFDYDMDPEPLRANFRSDNGIRMPMIDFEDHHASLCIHGLVLNVVVSVLPALNIKMTVCMWRERLAEIEALPCNNSWIRDPIGNVEAKFASTLSAGGAVLGIAIDDKEALEGYQAYKQHLTAYQRFPSVDHAATDQERRAKRFGDNSAAATNRVIFNTEDDFVRLGPKATKPGDILVILYGSQYPAVLRCHEDESCYFFVGLTYVYGIMKGEAVREYKARGVEDTLFCYTLTEA
jgi:hypothetical protein